MLNFLICLVIAILTVYLWRIDEHVYSIMVAIAAVLYAFRGLIAGFILIFWKAREYKQVQKALKARIKREG